MVVSSITLPAWCAAASGIGTKYKSVEMPSRTWRLAIANADVAMRFARGGRTARSAGLNVDAYSAAVAQYVVIAWKKGERGVQRSALVLCVPETARLASTHQTSVVELDGGGVLEDVAPPDVRPVGALCVRRVEELICRRGDAATHERELVVQQASIKTRDECTYIRCQVSERR